MNSPIKYFATEQPTQFLFEQLEQASQAITGSFESHSLQSIRDDLRRWYEAAISSNYPAYESGEERSQLFYLYRQLELFIEAAYMLYTAKSNIEEREPVRTPIET